MAEGTFLAIGVIGLVLLAVSALLGADEADVDMDLDLDVDVDLDTDADLDSPTGGGMAGTVLEWLSIKAIAVAAVGFGFVGWAATANGAASFVALVSAITTAIILWILAVRFLFPWLRQQQGDDLQPLEAYEGLPAEVVVRIPPDGIGTVQFTDPNGAVVRRDARSTHHGHEIKNGTQVLIVLSKSDHVVVDEFSFFEDTR